MRCWKDSEAVTPGFPPKTRLLDIIRISRVPLSRLTLPTHYLLIWFRKRCIPGGGSGIVESSAGCVDVNAHDALLPSSDATAQLSKRRKGAELGHPSRWESWLASRVSIWWTLAVVVTLLEFVTCGDSMCEDFTGLRERSVWTLLHVSRSVISDQNKGVNITHATSP